jgi:hypothetical protein
LFTDNFGHGSKDIAIPANMPTGDYNLGLFFGNRSALSKSPMVTVVGAPPLLNGILTLSGKIAQRELAGATMTIALAYTNNLGSRIDGNVYAVIQNQQGQTVAVASSSISLQAYETRQVLILVPNVAPGTYILSVFALTTSGVSISESRMISVRI